MKVLYIILLSIIVAAARNHPLEAPEQKDRYFVMAPHTPEQCRSAMIDMKESDKIQLSKFDFGCNYNDHTFYGVVEGTSVEDVRTSLPKVLQTNAKIKKVDKLSAEEIEKMQKM
jgi:hypothetical protein